jgi:hypothetical protein
VVTVALLLGFSALPNQLARITLLVLLALAGLLLRQLGIWERGLLQGSGVYPRNQLGQG